MNDGFADHPLEPLGHPHNRNPSRIQSERAARAEPNLFQLCRVAREDDLLPGEFDRARTCVNKCHKLAPKPLGHKLHIVAPDGFEPPLTDSNSVVLTITPWGIVAETSQPFLVTGCKGMMTG